MDNTVLNPGALGDTIATLDVLGVKHELVVTEFSDGAGGVTKVSAATPLPVMDAVSEAALNSIAAEDFATQTTLAAVLAKITSDPATQTTLAAILAKIIAAPSTAAKQDAEIALLTTIAAITQPLTDTQLRATPVPISGTVTVDTSLLATQATLASILAKIITAPATEAKQDTGNTSLASILAKIIAAPSTEAKQDTIITALATLLTISDFDSKTGSLTETAPATDTASSGVNGRLQRIAQRLSSLITALGSPFQAGGSIGNTSFGANAGTNLNTSALNLEATQADIRTALQIMDDWDETDRAKVNVIVGQAGIAAGTGVDGATVPRVSLATNVPLPAGSNAIGKLAANSGVTIGDINVISNIPGTGATNLGKAEDAVHASGDVGVMALGVANEAQSTFAADGDYIPLATDVKGNPSIVGNIAHDIADAGKPVKVGMKAISFGTNPTAVTANDRTDWYANLAGIPFMLGGHPNIICLRAASTGAQTDVALITVGAGAKIVVTRITVTASAANSVNPSVIIGFGTANTPTTTGVVLSHPAIAPGSGVVEGNGAGILGVGADNEDLRITNSVPTGGSIDVIISYFTITS